MPKVSIPLKVILQIYIKTFHLNTHTGTLSRHFDTYGACLYLYWGTDFVFSLIIFYLFTYIILMILLIFRNSKISLLYLSLPGIHTQHQYSTL